MPPMEFLRGEIGMGSGRAACCCAWAWLTADIDLALLARDDGDPLDIIECVGDLADDFDFLAAAALDSESEPESHASSSPQSFVEDIDHLDGAWTPLRI